ncbi:MAG: winged helix-turn-helix domain-containing protein, partial [Actinomycetota bacterium]|nr:winged helix-turn-helix domain-containing protein [Actinomycetota bacterium]
MEFRILGPLEAVADGEALEMGTPRQRALLALLLVRAGQTVSTDRLADDLWDGAPPETARHSLQTYVHRLRRALGAEAWRLETRPPGYQLKVSVDELDALRFEQLAADGHRALVRGDTEAAFDLLTTSLDLWRGTVLADLNDVSALEPERARLDGLRLTAVEERIEADLQLGRHVALAEEITALLDEHPYRERLWGQLMLALYRTGRQGDAVRTFRQAQEVLAEELGLDPSPWLSRLHERILLQDPDLEAPAAEHGARPDTPRTLPTPRDTFVGRRRERAELDGLVRTRRLVTVTGPPGCGKTRLAVELGLDLLDDFPHGVFLVPLAEIEGPDRIAVAIAGALGLATGDRPASEALEEYLRSRRLLLLLDNFEHVLAGAPVVAQLLDAAPQLRVLATSRAPLRLSGEQQYPLASLPVPDADEAQHPAANDAVTLFADRAGAVDPRFVLDGGTAPVVAQVVGRLDGLPLAIELAAARLRLFPLDELHRR